MLLFFVLYMLQIVWWRHKNKNNNNSNNTRFVDRDYSRKKTFQPRFNIHSKKEGEDSLCC